jgi:hypothetical protein
MGKPIRTIRQTENYPRRSSQVPREQLLKRQLLVAEIGHDRREMRTPDLPLHEVAKVAAIHWSGIDCEESDWMRTWQRRKAYWIHVK